MSSVVSGKVVIGLCSPYVSEDNTILLRSLLGRTCTLLHTCGGRHDIHGLYVDCIMNERRLQGERHRENVWLGWMTFLTNIAKLCAKSGTSNWEEQVHGPNSKPCPTNDRDPSAKYRYSEFIEAQGGIANGAASWTHEASNIRLSKAAVVDVQLTEYIPSSTHHVGDQDREVTVTGFETMRPSQQVSGKFETNKRNVVSNTFRSLDVLARVSMSTVPATRKGDETGPNSVTDDMSKDRDRGEQRSCTYDYA